MSFRRFVTNYLLFDREQLNRGFGRHECQFQSTPAAGGGIAPRNKLTDDFKKEVLKHLPAMRDLNLTAAAEYMESWVRGELPLAPLLDVRGCLALHPVFVHLSGRNHI